MAHVQLQTAMVACRYLKYRFLDIFVPVLMLFPMVPKLTCFETLTFQWLHIIKSLAANPGWLLDEVTALLYRWGYTRAIQMICNPETKRLSGNQKLRLHQKWQNSWKLGFLSHSLLVNQQILGDGERSDWMFQYQNRN